MRGRKPSVLSVAPSDEDRLHTTAHSDSLPWYQVRRARILLALAAGQRKRDVAAQMEQRPKTGLEPSKVVLYHFAQHSVRHGDPLGRYGGRYNAPPLASRHRLQTLGT